MEFGIPDTSAVETLLFLNRYMSLRSGFASLASSASKVARFAFGRAADKESSVENDSNDVSTDGEPNDGGTTDGGDSADGAPKGEVF